MATERQSPDALLALTNLTGTVSEIQDDPDSPDANWLDAVATNLDTAVRVSFPTPTGNPTVGAGLQEFRVLVRRTGTAKVPNARIELWESGSLIRAGSAVDVTAATIISFTWNANEISTPDGSLVECYVYGVKNATVAVEVGAIEWNVTYSAGVIEYLVGTASGIGTLAGIAYRSRAVVGTLAGAGTAAGLIYRSRALVGTIAGSGVVAGIVYRFRGIAGTLSGIGSAIGALTVTLPFEYLIGTLSGAGSLIGNVVRFRLFAGTTAGVGTVVGILKRTRLLVGSFAGAGLSSGILRRIKVLTGSVMGVGSAIGNLTITTVEYLTGILSGVGSLIGKLSPLRIMRIITDVSISQACLITKQLSKSLNLTTGLTRSLRLTARIEEK